MNGDKSGIFTIAFVGNPNSGKTTLFNALTGSSQRIGNWPGVTVEKLEGEFSAEGRIIKVVDLPGIYSLTSLTDDERVARDYILSGEADLYVNIVDATNLTRNLLLTAQLIEMHVPVLLTVNMMDLASKTGIEIDIDHLGKSLGLKTVGIAAVEKSDASRFVRELIDALEKTLPAAPGVRYANEIEEVIREFKIKLESTAGIQKKYSRWFAIKLLEHDEHVEKLIKNKKLISSDEIGNKRKRMEKTLGEDSPQIINDFRYGYVQAIVTHVIKKKTNRRSFTDSFDRFALSPVFGIPLFFLVMYGVFWATTTLGGAFIDFFDRFFGTIFVDGFGALLDVIGAPSWLTAILASGLGTGVQTVATFIPIIFMMFFMLALLEDSGYMARAAFIMDRFMRFLGLPGKAFVPLIVGFGCTVPAIMATRTLEQRRDKLLTIFIAPLMSCGARLPVYALFAAVFFRGQEGNIVFSLYMAGIVMAVFSGFLLKKTLFAGDASHFIMELPSYHAPRLNHIFLHTTMRLKMFVFKAGKLILVAVTILGFLNSLGTDGSFGNEDSSKSVLAAAGKTISPVFEPMGVKNENWPASVALVSGIFAKESVVGTLASLYSQTEAVKTGTGVETEPAPFDFWAGLLEALKTIPDNLAGVFAPVVSLFTGPGTEDASGTDEALFREMRTRFGDSPAAAYAYLLFVLIYFPCVGAMGAIFREAGKAIGFLVIGYLTALGWITATLFYQIAEGGQILWIIVALGLLAGISVLFVILRRPVNKEIGQ
ncbi:MAG: Fe(2+) transporter permease subunit FeoB [Spirochaetales bacterium]|nr:Fe(2+) transporter permease subunit FeoB [Spirochaetales bacterium]